MTLRTITTMAPSIGRFFIMPFFFATAPPPQLRFCFLSFYLLKDTSLAIDNNGYAYEWRWRWQRLLGRETTGWNKEGIKSRDAGMYFFVTFLLRCPGFYWNWTLSYFYRHQIHVQARSFRQWPALPPAGVEQLQLKAEAIRVGLDGNGIAAQCIRLVLAA